MDGHPPEALALLRTSLADPGRSGARDPLAGARGRFLIANRPAGEGVTIHVLRPRPAA